MKSDYIITGRMLNQPTFLSQVRVLDYKTMKHKWITEQELLNIMKNGDNVINIDSISRGDYDVPCYHMVSNQRRMIGVIDTVSNTYINLKIALGIVKKQTKVLGILILKAPNTFEVVKIGSKLDMLKGALNIDTSTEIQQVVGKRSIIYKEHIPEISIEQLRKLKWDFAK